VSYLACILGWTRLLVSVFTSGQLCCRLFTCPEQTRPKGDQINRERCMKRVERLRGPERERERDILVAVSIKVNRKKR